MSIVCIVYKERSSELDYVSQIQCLNYHKLKYRCTVYFKGSVKVIINYAFIYCAMLVSK